MDDSPHKCDFGTCNSTFAHNYTCICDSGYQGVFCSDDLDECLEPEGLTYCQNNGTCINGVNTKTCDCTGTGWEGTQCDTMVNDCILPMGQLGTPCENGGNCTDAFNDYVCDCVTGWIGDECQADVNECAVADPIGDFNPCENGGICLDQIGSYECDCFNTGYEGDLCDVDIDECLLFPCQNGGKPFFNLETNKKYTNFSKLSPRLARVQPKIFVYFLCFRINSQNNKKYTNFFRPRPITFLR